jgi:hypothetical protein
MVEELLEKIPPEKRWKITAKILTGLQVLRGEKSVAPLLGIGEGVFTPVMGAEKWQEIHVKIYGDGGKITFPLFKEMFNIPVENAIDADNLSEVVAAVSFGPELEGYIVEKTPEKVVARTTRCAYMERYKEFEVDSALIPCVRGCPAWYEEGFKAINPKLTYKVTKAMPLGDPYCEHVYELKDE